MRFATVAALVRRAYAETRAAMLSVAGVAQPVAANVPDANTETDRHSHSESAYLDETRAIGLAGEAVNA